MNGCMSRVEAVMSTQSDSNVFAKVFQSRQRSHGIHEGSATSGAQGTNMSFVDFLDYAPAFIYRPKVGGHAQAPGSARIEAPRIYHLCRCRNAS